MPLLTTREVITGKVETTYNTDSVPTALANAALIGNPSWSHEGLRMIDRNIVKSTDASNQKIFGGTLKTITFDIELKGSGTVGTAPEFGVYLKGCGFTETVVLDTSVTYDPSSTEADKKSLSIYYYQDGLLHKITGARGNVTFNLETGALPIATFTFTGHSGAPTDVPIVTPTLQTTEPVAVKGNAFTIGGYAAAINALQFDMGINIITPANMAASDGYGEIFIGNRDLNGSIDPQAELVATNNFYGQFLAGTVMALTTGAIGSAAGNLTTITMGKVYYQDVSAGDRDGIRTYELPIGALESSGDDEVSIAFT